MENTEEKENFRISKIMIDEFKKFLVKENTEKSQSLIKKLDGIKNSDQFTELQAELRYRSLLNAFN